MPFSKTKIMQHLKHFKILKDPFAPILEFQEEIKRLGGDVLANYDVYEAIVNSRDSIEVSNRLLNLIYNNYGDEFQKMFRIRKAYYLKNSESVYQITVDRPSEKAIEDGEAKPKISLKDSQLITVLNPYNSVLIERQNGDMAIIFNETYSNVAQIINNSKSTIDNKTIFETPKMKDGTKNIIAACILALGLIIASCIYAFSNRYEVNTDGPPKRIDHWHGTFEYIESK